MKKLTGIWMASAVAGVCLLGVSGKTAYSAPVVGGVAGAGYFQDRGWELPPQEFDEVTRRGFHDGVEGARKDFENHRRPDVNNREEFRHPDMPRERREAYRHGFERGYRAGVEHFYNRR